jgi:hypothetical protein
MTCSHTDLPIFPLNTSHVRKVKNKKLFCRLILIRKFYFIQKITGITYAESESPVFEMKLTAALTAALDLGPGAVVTLDSITYVNARRHLLADSINVAYTVTGTNVAVQFITAAVMASVTTGSLSNLLKPDYPAASAQTTPTTTDKSTYSLPPSMMPSMLPTAQSGSNHQFSVSSFIVISAMMLALPYNLL